MRLTLHYIADFMASFLTILDNYVCLHLQIKKHSLWQTVKCLVVRYGIKVIEKQ